VKKILIIQPYRLGDVLQTTPVLQALKVKYGDVSIDFVVDSACAVAIRGNPYVSRLIVLPRKSIQDNGRKNAIAGFRELYAFLGEILQTRYDLAVNYNFDEPGGILLKECDAVEKRGVMFHRGKFEMNDPWTKYLFAIIKSRQYSFINITDIFKLMAGVGGIRSSLYLKTGPGEAAIRAKFLDFSETRPVVALQGFASRMERSFSPAENAELIRKLSSKYNVALLGAAGEEKYMPGLKDTGSFRNLTGKTTLEELSSVIGNCGLLITPDTFAMHAAAALGTPAAAVFKAGAWPFETAPYASGVKIIFSSDKCAPCNFPETCGNKRCGSEITPEFMFCIAENILEKKDQPTASGNLKILESKKEGLLSFDMEHLEKILSIIEANGLISGGKMPIIPVKRELRDTISAFLSGMRNLEADLKRN